MPTQQATERGRGRPSQETQVRKKMAQPSLSLSLSLPMKSTATNSVFCFLPGRERTKRNGEEKKKGKRKRQFCGSASSPPPFLSPKNTTIGLAEKRGGREGEREAKKAILSSGRCCSCLVCCYPHCVSGERGIERRNMSEERTPPPPTASSMAGHPWLLPH